ncbi:MAG: MBL fold metallo-hydrolase [Cyanobacteria bacterium REEB459]|nr:MBL fold metallo-hydrolase [Cyanobacteria bacterium REEB459]
MAELLPQFLVRFWGVRGSIPSPGPHTVRYGGNTPCVEMLVGGQRLIFDGGTGLRQLGLSLLKAMPVQATLFFSHSHWDHIQGFPFFTPAFVPGNRFRIYGAIAPNGSTIEQRLRDQMLHPNFPVPLQVMRAKLEFCNLAIGEPLQLEDITVHSALLNHPGQSVGYRVSWGDRSAAYITDTEHFPDGLSETLVTLVQDTDVMIYDATYTDEEYYHPSLGKAGWGHSTWQEAVKLARAARVKTLVIFHHDPAHDDNFMDQVAEQARQAFSGAVVAQEGMVIDLSSALAINPGQEIT